MDAFVFVEDTKLMVVTCTKFPCLLERWPKIKNNRDENREETIEMKILDVKETRR